MPVRILNSKQNARLKELQRALRSPDRRAGALVGIEGPHLIEEAARAGLRIRAVFAGDEFQDSLARFRLAPETETVIMPTAILASTFVTDTPQPIAALVESPEWTW